MNPRFPKRRSISLLCTLALLAPLLLPVLPRPATAQEPSAATAAASSASCW